jgi:hypothetical protein
MNAGFDVALHGMRLSMKGGPAAQVPPPDTEKKERPGRLPVLSFDATHAVSMAALAVASLVCVVLTAVHPPCVYVRAWASVVMVLLAAGLNRLCVLQTHADALLAVALLTLASSASTAVKDTVLMLGLVACSAQLVACSAHAVARRRCEDPPQQAVPVLLAPGLAAVLLLQSGLALAFWGELSEQFRSALLAAFLALYAACLSLLIVLKLP